MSIDPETNRIRYESKPEGDQEKIERADQSPSSVFQQLGNVAQIGVRNTTYRTREPGETVVSSSESIFDGTTGSAGDYTQYTREDGSSGEEYYDIWETKTDSFVIRDGQGNETNVEDPNRLKLYEEAPNTDLGFEMIRRHLLHGILSGEMPPDRALELSRITQERLSDVHAAVEVRQQRQYDITAWEWGEAFEKINENPFSDNNQLLVDGGGVGSFISMMKDGFDVVHTSYHRNPWYSAARSTFLGDRSFYASPVTYVQEGYSERPEKFFIARSNSSEIADWPNSRDANDQTIDNVRDKYFMEVNADTYDLFLKALKLQTVLDFNITDLAYTRGIDGGYKSYYSQYKAEEGEGSPVSAEQVITPLRHEPNRHNWRFENIPGQWGYNGSTDTPARRMLKWCYQHSKDKAALDERANKYFDKIQDKLTNNRALFESYNSEG